MTLLCVWFGAAGTRGFTLAAFWAGLLCGTTRPVIPQAARAASYEASKISFLLKKHFFAPPYRGGKSKGKATKPKCSLIRNQTSKSPQQLLEAQFVTFMQSHAFSEP